MRHRVLGLPMLRLSLLLGGFLFVALVLVPPGEAEEQEKLFQRYYRGTSTNDSYAGSGLGLAIAREIIQAHGGNIHLRSKVGEGTTVQVTF